MLSLTVTIAFRQLVTNSPRASGAFSRYAFEFLVMFFHRLSLNFKIGNLYLTYFSEINDGQDTTIFFLFKILVCGLVK